MISGRGLGITGGTLDKLESIQRNLAKWILGHDRNAAGIAAISELGWKSMHHMYELKKVLMYGRLKYEEMEDSRWIRKAFIESQAQKGNIWWNDVFELSRHSKSWQSCNPDWRPNETYRRPNETYQRPEALAPGFSLLPWPPEA